MLAQMEVLREREDRDELPIRERYSRTTEISMSEVRQNKTPYRRLSMIESEEVTQ
jgi:hypothetical protein